MSSSSGGMVLPLTDSLIPYAVNDIVLDTQPTTCTAPAVGANTIPVGSTFVLLFNNASDATKAALATGSTVSLSFCLSGGSSVTGQVQVSSVSSDSVFQALFTVTQTIYLLV